MVHKNLTKLRCANLDMKMVAIELQERGISSLKILAHAVPQKVDGLG